MQKHRIYTNIGVDQKVTVELKQDYDLLEILSLKFSQQEAYSSFCGDYGVVVGRIIVNNGLGVPNARVSIFVPISEVDENDPVISTLYPYKSIEEKNENNYRYNLLPSRKQHTGHTPTGTFPDQEDILNREEYLEVFEKFYKYTAKTNDAGDFMIWGVPLGKQTLHIDLDLSDMGCQSLVPYDLIYDGISEEKFVNKYTYASSSDLDALPQIVSFDKSIEVYSFWGNPELCQIGITRTDFDLSSQGIKINPYAIMVGGSFTDSGKDALRVNCNVDNQMGEKCRLITFKGDVESIRFTGEYEETSGGTPNPDRPIMEFFDIDSTIDENGAFFFRIPMNMKYIATNEFGEIYETNDPNVGVATAGNYRFRLSLNEDTGARNRFTGKFLIPNAREYHINDTSFVGGISTIDPKSYSFSNNIDDYPQDARKEIAGTSVDAISENKLGIPQDYFYQFRYGRIYTVGQFMNKYYKTSALERVLSFFKKDRRESFIGIKENWPQEKDDCEGVNNYFPVNDAVRNHRFQFFIITVINYIEFIGKFINLFIKEFVTAVLFGFANALSGIKVVNKAAAKQNKAAKEYQFKQIFKLPLIIYPDCYDCTEDNELKDTNTIPTPPNPQDYTSGPPIATNINFGEKYLPKRKSSTPCSEYTFTNTGLTGYSITYTDCDGVSVTEEMPANYIRRFCGQPSQSWVIPPIFTGLSYTESSSSKCQDGNLDGDLYFNVPCDTYTFTHIGSLNYHITGYTNCDNQQAPPITITAPNPSTGVTFVTLYAKKGTVFTIPPSITGLSVTVTPGSTAFCGGYELAPWTGVTFNGVQLNRSYIVEIDIFNDGSTQQIAIGCGTKYPIIWDGPASSLNPNVSLYGPTNNWKIGGGFYDDIANEIKEEYSTQMDQPINGTIHNKHRCVLISKMWEVPGDCNNNANDPDARPAGSPERGCDKYDFIIDTKWTEDGGEGKMNLKGFVFPLAGFPDYATMRQWLINNQRSNSTGYYPSDSWDNNYPTSILNLHPDPCFSGTPYNVGAVLSYHCKWPMKFGGFDNNSVQCVINGAYYGEVKKKGPYYVDNSLTTQGTNSGFSEFRDGVYTIVPLAGKTFGMLKSWRRRKLFGQLMCGGVVSYLFTDSWLIGSLYFFQFMKRGKNDRLCKQCIYKFTDSSGLHLYYRSTPYNPNYTFSETQYDYDPATGTQLAANPSLTSDYMNKTKGFYGQLRTYNYEGSVKTKREINFPTAVVDLGPRNTWINEICVDPELDVNCSITRSVGSTSYKGLDDLIEYVIQSKEIKERGKLDVQDLFDARGYGLIDGDIAQLMNFNTQTGIYPFEYEEFDSPYTAQYSTIFDGRGAVGIDFVFSEDDPDTVITERYGGLIRRCLNEPSRLGDTSQKVPYYMWETFGHGFGEALTIGNSENQQFYNSNIYSQRLQLMKSNLNPDPNPIVNSDDDYFNPYVIPPIRDCLDYGSGNKKYNDNYKEYTVGGQRRHIMEIGTPFHYYFGLRKGKTAFDKFIELFGPF